MHARLCAKHFAQIPYLILTAQHETEIIIIILILQMGKPRLKVFLEFTTLP